MFPPLRVAADARSLGFDGIELHGAHGYLIEMIARNEADLVAVGRALLVDPAWATKVRGNRMQELLAFTPESLRFLS